jgi:hypothetical protein
MLGVSDEKRDGHQRRVSDASAMTVPDPDYSA